MEVLAGSKHLIHCDITGNNVHLMLSMVNCMLCVFYHVCMLSWVWLFVTLWTTYFQAPLSMGFSRQEYQSGLPFPTPEKYFTIIKNK